MTSSDWPPCIVTAFDLVGTKSRAASGRGSSKMIEMRSFAVAKVNNGLPLHSHAYIWNDSVLLLSYETKPTQRRRELLAELEDFKTALEQRCGARTYAISVKGLAFPQDDIAAPVFQGQIANQPRAVVLKTSSWAMANCFVIESTLGHHRADWYIDSRITRDTHISEPFARESLSLLPKKKSREIHMYMGPLGAGA